MNKIERVTAVLDGQMPDRAPVSFWYHFPSEQVSGPAAIEAHTRHVETYDLDFLKIMDDNRYPRVGIETGVIAEPGDLSKLKVLDGDEDTFGVQLELIGALVDRFASEMRIVTTIFNPWTALRQMTVPDMGVHNPPTLDTSESPRTQAMWRFMREAPEQLKGALDVLAESLANFARKCLAAGANGIFFSVRDDWLGTPPDDNETYDNLLKPGDLTVLDAASDASFNMLHVCGKARNFQRFAEYPVQVINWADRYAGPAIADVVSDVRPALCGGVDNLGTMIHGTPEDCEREVIDALEQAGDRPIIIAPGCTFSPTAVPSENLHAIRNAVESAG